MEDEDEEGYEKCWRFLPFTLPQHTHTHTVFGHELLKFWMGEGGSQLAQFELKFVISLLVVEQ